jgi:ferrous iron transport protein B
VKRIALVGNPNSGKTTLFNELTGANQHVGNWPGVTVEKKEGRIRSLYGEGDLIDLPGIYSLSPFTLEEVVARDYIVNERPDVVIDIVDATNLERNLYLSIQLMELDVPLVIALNFMDEVEREGLQVDVEHLSHDFGLPVIPISAARKTGIRELMAAIEQAQAPRRHELPNPSLERLIAKTEALLQKHLEQEHHLGDATAEGFPIHWTAIKVLESDDLVIRHLTLDEKTMQEIDELKSAFEAEHTLLCTAFADARYQFIRHVVYDARHQGTQTFDRYLSGRPAPVNNACQQREYDEDTRHRQELLEEIAADGQGAGQPLPTAPTTASAPDTAAAVAAGATDGKKRPGLLLTTSDRIDKVLTHRIWAIPIFLLVMFAMFHLTFSETLFGIAGLPSPGVWLQGLAEQLVEWVSSSTSLLFEPGSWAESLVVGGVISGVGAVLSFVPQILLLFFFLTLLEDCGYMARAAFVMDRLFRRFGLSGKSALPMLMGFGCTVPAAMACRTLETDEERKLTLMLVPFMSCGARAPIFLVFASAFFAANADLIIWGMYLIGIIVALASGILLKRLVFKGESSQFIIELPRYRAPRARSVALTLWDKLKGYLVRAGTIIFAMCVVVWFLSSFGFTAAGFSMVDSIEQSILAAIGNLIAPLFSPLGFGFWTAAVAILTGFIAKESVVGTLGVLFGVGEDSALEQGGLTAAVLMAGGFTPLAAFSFMVFCLLYVPCLAAVATLRKEFNSTRWTLFQATYSTGVAYLVALIIYQGGKLLGLS